MQPSTVTSDNHHHMAHFKEPRLKDIWLGAKGLINA